MLSVFVQTSHDQSEMTKDHNIDDIAVYLLLSVIGNKMSTLNGLHVTINNISTYTPVCLLRGLNSYQSACTQLEYLPLDN